jgi:DnaD/phage-associated family protein
MPWVKIDDKFAENQKVEQVGPLGMAMQVAALCYCNRNLTNGFIPSATTRKLINLEAPGIKVTLSSVIKSLLDAGLWEPAPGGYLIHDYLEFQPSKEKVEQERDDARRRMEVLRGKRKGQGGSQDVRPNNPGSSRCPVPVPVPGAEPDANQGSQSSSFTPSEELSDEEEMELLDLAKDVDNLLASVGVDLPVKDLEDFVGKVHRWRIELDVVRHAVAVTKKRARSDRLGYFKNLWRNWMERGVRTLEQARAAEVFHDTTRGP